MSTNTTETQPERSVTVTMSVEDRKRVIDALKTQRGSLLDAYARDSSYSPIWRNQMAAEATECDRLLDVLRSLPVHTTGE